MKIFGAVGLGLTIIILKWLMGDVFTAFEHLLLTSFGVGENVLIQGQSALGTLH